LKVRDSLSEVNRLADRLKKALDAKSGDEAALRKLYDQLVNKPGPYTENMLIAQFQNIAREIGQADQKIGASAYERYDELTKTLATLKAQIEKATPATAAM
jgi:chromosome segregation ATPase